MTCSSPTLFENLVADVLTRMIINAQKNDLFVGLASHMIDRGVAILWYADDMILCIKYDYEMFGNLKLLYLYEMLLGLKFNFCEMWSSYDKWQ